MTKRTQTYPGYEPTRRRRNGLLTSGLVAATAATGSVATNPDEDWFRNLDKPAWQPPAVAFPVVWTGLYSDIAFTSAAVLNELEERGEVEKAAAYRTALVTNLALNGLWSWLFFRWHHLGAAALGAGALAASSVQLARKAGQVRPRHGWLLALYAAWTSFATVLSSVIWWRNRDR